MGDQMAAHRSALDYKPTAMKRAEAAGAAVRQQPWRLPEPAGPVCGLPPRMGDAAVANAAGGGGGRPGCSEGEVPHLMRRRRSGREFAER
jgi:hypothetical protein